MELHLQHISKRFGKSWIFRDVNHIFRTGRPAAVTGRNGSGKSTLLKIISGGLAPTDGDVALLPENGKAVHWSDGALLTAYAAPYIELIERLTLEEHIRFHFSFRKPIAGMAPGRILQELELDAHSDKEVRDFSSGMKQRLKLALAFYTEAPLLLLDEPTSNLDEQWTQWYEAEIERQTAGRIVVIASNQSREFACCTEVLDLADFP